jgi:SAM-dependent methyltransferase/acyl carrier protein
MGRDGTPPVGCNAVAPQASAPGFLHGSRGAPLPRVLEIGCGTGLLLFRLAALTSDYLATDFSPVALDLVRRRLARPGGALPQVRLRQAEATDWSGIPAGKADLVVLNSVVQYFPSAAHLTHVLRQAAVALAPGGRLFVGDVRSRPLLPALGAEVELAQAPPERSAGELRHRLRQRLAGEEELVLDPAFFETLAGWLPGVWQATLLLKRGRRHNELTRFRYDVVLHAGPAAQEAAEAAVGEEIDASAWPVLDEAVAGRLLDRQTGSRPLLLRRLVNARLTAAAALVELLGAGAAALPDTASAAELRRAVEERTRSRPGIDPEELWQWASRHGYAAELLVEPRSPFHFAASLRRPRQAGGSANEAADHLPSAGTPGDERQEAGWLDGSLPSAAMRQPRRPAAGGLGALSREAPEVGSLGRSDDRRDGSPPPGAEPDWQAMANDPLRGDLRRRLVPELRRHLAAELPEHMIPSAFALLDRLPLGEHGKVDRAALPPPEMGAGASGGTPPRSEVELRLAALWQEVLGVERISLEDSFFELGGHSLLATRLASRIEAAFGIALPVRRIFERPLLADLAAAIPPGGGAPAAPSASPEPPVVSPQPLPARPMAPREAPLSFAQERYWAVARDGDPSYNVPAPLRLRGPISAAALARSFAEILRRHDTLRSRIVETADGPLQRIDPPAPWLLPLADLSTLPPPASRREARRLLEHDVNRPFDLARGPLLRATLLRLGPGEHVLLLNVHHIVADGWSMSLLESELIQLYAALAAGLPSPLAEPRVQYADLAVVQRRRLSGEALAARIEHWRGRLAGAPELLGLPLDRPRPAALGHRGGAVTGLLPAALAGHLGALAAAAGASLHMILLAALAAVLRRWSGQDDIVIGSPDAGRERLESEAVIGPFLNLLPLRIDLRGEPTFRRLLGRVRETALDAHAHRELPFEPLVAALALRRARSHTPIFQVNLNLLNLPRTDAAPPAGITVEPITDLPIWSKYDLTLYAAETAAGVLLRLHYAAELFTPGRMQALLDELRATLAAAATRPDEPA